MFNTFKLYNLLFVHPLSCKCHTLIISINCIITPPLVSVLYFKVLLKSGEALLLEIRYRHSTQVDVVPFQA